MKKIEDKLFEITVEKPEPNDFQHELRRELVQKFVKPAPNYQMQFRLAFGVACVMMFFAFLIIADPRVALKLNEVTLNNYQPENVDTNVTDPSFPDNLQYTTINNPKLIEQIDAEGYEEEKAYIIRQYSANNKEPVMVVSEFKKDSQNVIRQTSAKGI